jgi:hypothetical protein
MALDRPIKAANTMAQDILVTIIKIQRPAPSRAVSGNHFF